MATNPAEATADQNHGPSGWGKTRVASLLRYKPSGTYFARVLIRGKLFRQSLHTHTMSVAKLRLGEKKKNH